MILLLLSGSVAAISVQAADKVRIGFPDLAATFLSLPLAQKKGFLQDEGLQAELIRTRGAITLPALLSGELDYSTNISLAVSAGIQGSPIKVVACYVPGAAIMLIARPEFRSVQELRGKIIGVNTVAPGVLMTAARLIFKHFGLDADKEVKFLGTGPMESRFAAMQQGLTAATLGAPPTDFVGKKMGFVVLARAHELFSYPVGGLVASVKKIKERPDEIKRVIKAGIKANCHIHQNRDGTIQVMTEWMKIDKEMASATYDSGLKAFNETGSVPEVGLRLVIEEAKKAAKVDREVRLNEITDLSILKEAQNELGIKGN